MLEIRKAVGSVIILSKKPGFLVLIKKVKVEDVASGMAVEEWDIPKGGIKGQETEEQALWRELSEEVSSQSFKVVEKLPFKIVFDFSEGSSTKYSGQETTIFLLEFTGDEEELKPGSSEIGEVFIADFKKALDLIKFKETKEVLLNLRNSGKI